jgi:hypothetical protein
MLRRFWLLSGATVAVLLPAATAAARTSTTTGSAGAESAAAPFAQAWTDVPRTPAGRRTKSVLVFGMTGDVNGFNSVLACCNTLQSVFMGGTETGRGRDGARERGRALAARHDATLRRARGLPPLVPALVLRPGDRERFLAVGFDGYISKPVNVVELVDTVKQYCGLSLRG